MSKNVEVVLGEHVFKSKSKLQDYCKKTLKFSTLNSHLSGKPFYIINELFKRHVDYNNKIKGKSYSIGVRNCPDYPKNRQFYVEFDNGKVEVFSYIKCITNPSHESLVKRSLRCIISGQMKKYKDAYFDRNCDELDLVPCQATGILISMEMSHLDHYPLQFDELVAQWFSENNLLLKDVKVKSDSKLKVPHTLKDNGLVKSFSKFHKENAKYRVVIAGVNRTRPKAKVKIK